MSAERRHKGTELPENYSVVSRINNDVFITVKLWNFSSEVSTFQIYCCFCLKGGKPSLIF